MAKYVEKRKCRRFEIPGAEVKYKKIGLLSLNKNFSEACPVLNVSKGGLAFMCEKKFRSGTKLMVQLLAPNEIPLNLRAKVQWQGESAGTVFRTLGIQFMPFGPRRGWNPVEALDVLGKLDEQYGKHDDL